MTYTQQWALYTDEGFKGRVAMALVAAAKYVLEESTDTPNYRQRHKLAEDIIQNPTSRVPGFLPHIASNPTISAAGPVASLDTDLDYVIASQFTAVARLT